MKKHFAVCLFAGEYSHTFECQFWLISNPFKHKIVLID